MFAGTIESGLMGRNFESPVRQSSRRDIVLRVNQDIEYAAVLFTDEMLMPLDERIEMLPAKHQHLEFLIGDQFLRLR